MEGLKVILDGSGCWPDLRLKRLAHIKAKPANLQIATIRHGMISGLPSVCLRIEIDQANAVLLEMSLRSFLTVADIFRRHYGILEALPARKNGTVEA